MTIWNQNIELRPFVVLLNIYVVLLLFVWKPTFFLFSFFRSNCFRCHRTLQFERFAGDLTLTDGCCVQQQFVQWYNCWRKRERERCARIHKIIIVIIPLIHIISNLMIWIEYNFEFWLRFSLGPLFAMRFECGAVNACVNCCHFLSIF